MIEFRVTFTGLFVYALEGEGPFHDSVRIIAPPDHLPSESTEARHSHAAHFGYLQLREGRFSERRETDLYPDGRIGLRGGCMTIGQGKVHWSIRDEELLEGSARKDHRLDKSKSGKFAIQLMGGQITPGPVHNLYRVDEAEACLALTFTWACRTKDAFVSFGDPADETLNVHFESDNSLVHLVIGHEPAEELFPVWPPDELAEDSEFKHAPMLYGLLDRSKMPGGGRIPTIKSRRRCGDTRQGGGNPRGSIRHCLGLVTNY